MSEPSTTDPAPVTMSREAFDLLVNTMYSQGWEDARYWPNRRQPFTMETCLEVEGSIVTRFGATRR